MDFCGDLSQVITLLKNVIKLIQWGIPMVLILFGMIDLGKAVMAGKEDEMKKAQSTLIKRVIYAVAVFLVVTIVTFAMGLVGSTDWKDCWNNVGGSNTNGAVEG
ncbi:MAG: hypothetical protein MR598_00945 [Erysipelotrichaceae bacterium]|nr:hypothetical protein [Erysipelotrichaceae bacterium]